MIAGNTLFRLFFVSALAALPYNASAAKSEKCSAGMDYIGPAPISVKIPDAVSVPADRSTSATTDLSVLFTDMLTKSKAKSMTVALADQNGSVWTETQGLTEGETLHYWASVGKSFTAVIIMQLVENGRLSLDDKLSNWIADVPNGDLITIKMLLDHTSGLYSANEDKIQRNPHEKPRNLTLQENIKILKKHGPLFCPGQYWRYSNTGYLFLGTIAEEIYEQPLSQIIQGQIIDKITLENSRTLTPTGDISDIANAQPSDDQQSDMRTPGPAGPIAATSADMILFWRALLAGYLVKPETRNQMFATLYPMFDQNTYYGLGVMAMRAPRSNGEQAIWVGNAGGMPGIKAFVMIDPVSRQYASVALTGDGPASAVAYTMLQKWQETISPDQ